MKKLQLLMASVLMSLNFYSQDWAEMMQDPNANYYQVKAAFENYWANRDYTEKGKGYKVFKRWENFVERRAYPSGDLSQLGQTAANFNAFVASQNQGAQKLHGNGGQMTASSTWTAAGPFGPINGSASGQLLKSGRLNFITISPTNSLHLWVGAPAGGLWKSTNGGASWTTNTDNLGVTGCSDMVIDPTNSNIMYLATGDGDGSDTRSIGVLKTTNGGITWNNTGLSNQVTNSFYIRKLLIHPTNPQILFAATNTGIYRSTNAAVNWTQVSNINTFDLEFKPGDPNTIYAAGAYFRVSTNGGSNFSTVSNGIPTSGTNRMAIAVTPADPNYVYVIASNSSGSGYNGFYTSVNSGISFSVSPNSLNLLGWQSNGSDANGQGWYDLCIAASPLNKFEVVTGGVNVWRTTNGGSNFSLYGHWTGSGAPFTHADHHDLEYYSNGVLFNANDGTVYRRDPNSWVEISGTMNISQIYRIGLSSLTANRWITGHQDNGTSIWSGITYNAAIGGDGMDCFFDRTNNANVFGETQNGGMRKSTNGGVNWASCTSGLSGTAPWVTIWKQDPQNANTLYCGRTDLFRSTNLAGNWSSLTAIPGNGTIREFAIAPSNNQVIYVLKSSGIYKTTNGGSTWSNVTGIVPVGSALPEYIAIDPTDPNKAWVVLSGYSSGNKIFRTINGGTSWSNYSANLPNIPANCVLYEPNSNDRIYVGMDVGVYYRDSQSATWTLYNNGLPNVPISELEITPAAPGLLYAATYGRGVWIVSLFSALAPVSNFSFPQGSTCPGSVLTFSDQSSNGPTTWSWSVSPTGSVLSQGSQVTGIQFPAPGTYTVSLQAGNNIGAGSVYIQTISIISPPQLQVSINAQTICPGGTVTYTVAGANSYSWSNGGGISSVVTYSPSSATIYSVTGNSNGCVSTGTASVHLAAAPTVSVSGTTELCKGGSANLLGSGASSYTWSTGHVGPFISVSPNSNSSYTLTGASVNGCTSAAVQNVNIVPAPQITVSSNDTVVCPGALIFLKASGAANYTWQPGGLSGTAGIFNPLATTTYTCYGINVAGCEGTTTFMVSVIDCETGVDIEELQGSEKAFAIFPNPVKNLLSVRRGVSQVQTAEVQIVDVAGKLVLKTGLRYTNGNDIAEIDTDKLRSGSYFIFIESPDRNSVLYRFVKE